MFFSQPFILASDFIQHVMLLVSCGIVTLGYCMYRDTIRAQHRTLLMVVVIAAFWIVMEYFVPVKLLQFHLYTHIPLILALIAYLYRIDLTDMPPSFMVLRRIIVVATLVPAGIDIVQISLMAQEPRLLRSLLKTIEVFGLYVFVVQFARHYRMQHEATIFNLTPVKRFATQAVVALMLFFVSAPSVGAFSLTTRIGDQSTELKAGDRLYFDVEIKWPENDRRQDLRVEYQILSDGQIIASEKVLRAVETQASFLDYIVVPQNALEGMKELNVFIETYDQSLSENISATFYVASSENKMLVYFIILACAIALVIMLVIVQIAMIMRTQKALQAHPA
ncbi:hypothetical protein A3C89_03090 [Candidatus Kaiserbacteria bacterium RIFCSPHIGHO2_02_FULL_50_50]|uniref:Uncharacterized protein n=1 Tax=Candidatus Kaiserbacteria bacterium RIFCSPHIGHO2_02_FULL_50_50 TaxID=1798492 RepID=A0A1F6DES8_9BACT|nr:MAG: hypothetical protein A3C89_03090 [Candidatus Kaiserbacteria bacterium RIFCSPHIGHO2_02_FULL_50_50]OGG89065.1 MAG: hypothetical protein A3G62_04005 [Candidatus Kaiserbacteria bacterium RIFCSPLOWO2_12_FULL_50_10]